MGEEREKFRYELAPEGLRFFGEVFDQFSSDGEQLTASEAKELYRTAPFDPFAPPCEVVTPTSNGKEEKPEDSLMSIPAIDFYPITKSIFLFMWRFVQVLFIGCSYSSPA